MLKVKFVNDHFSWASDPLKKSFNSRMPLLLRLTKSWNKKWGPKTFCNKTFFLSGLNRKLHIDISGDIAVGKQNVIRNVFWWFLLKKLFMTMASSLVPDKRHIKASSDIHLKFPIVLSDFFFMKNALSLAPSTQNHRNGSTTTISFHKESDEWSHKPRSRTRNSWS